MPFHRPQDTPTPEYLVPKFEEAIKGLVRRFRNHPFAFYTESDMHCYLYHRLYSGGFVNGLYRTKEGRDTILLHKEYPTVARYQRLENGNIEISDTGRRRGAFDISVWDPRFVSQHEHRTQKVLLAAELALNECGARSSHTINDATKLAGPSNEIKYGYLIFFVRDDGYGKYQKNKDEVWENLNDAAKRVRVVFAMVNGIEKPKPQYLGKWGEV